MKSPLSVHVLYHTSNSEGEKIYSNLYSLLCRDVTDPFSDGLDIPVYFSKGDDKNISPLAQSSSQKKVLLVCIDINMFCAENWRQYVASLVDGTDENTLIIGIKQYKHAFSFNKSIGETQSIVVDSSEMDNISLFDGNNWDVFTTGLFDFLIRFVSDKGTNAISVFISHTKRDKDQYGEKLAKEVRGFLASDTKLSSFFDVHDILDGYKFGDQIKDHIRNSALLILFTDNYSSREWCRIEALTAKEHHVPIVAVSLIHKGVGRVFPYIGNVPCITFDGDWRKVINTLLRTILDQTIESEMFKAEVGQDESISYLPYPPEAFNMSLLQDKTKLILYPEPPLGNEELDILTKITSKINQDLKFVTPMAFQTADINLEEKYVGISVSESHELPATGIGNEMLKDLQIELTRHILKANGRLIYGGDLRSGGFTELFREMAKQYGQQEKAKADVFYISNYLSWPIYNRLTLDQKAEYMFSRIHLENAVPGSEVKENEQDLFILPDSIENKLKWASSLTSMRKQVIEKSIARIIVGGKLHGFTGFMAGLAEEFKLAISQKLPIFLIGGFGGAGRMIVEIIEGKKTSQDLLDLACNIDDYKSFYEWCENNNHHIDYEALDNLKIEDLHNGLEDEENMRLFHSVDIVEIVSLVLLGLSNIDLGKA